MVNSYISEIVERSIEGVAIEYYYQLNEFGEVRRKQLRKEKIDEGIATELALKTYKASRSGSYGAWVAAALTFIGILVGIYFGCNPREPRPRTLVNSLPLAIDTVAKSNTPDSRLPLPPSPIEDSSGAVLDSEIPIPPPKSPSKVFFHSAKKGKIKVIQDNDYYDTIDPLPPKINQSASFDSLKK
jgi:hypothetical protein